KSALRLDRCRVPQILRVFSILVVTLLLGFTMTVSVRANDLDDAREQFDAGNYNTAIETVQKGLKDGFGGQERHLLLTKAFLTVGKYPEALNAVEQGMRQEPSSIRLRWLAREVYFSNGKPQ